METGNLDSNACILTSIDEGHTWNTEVSWPVDINQSPEGGFNTIYGPDNNGVYYVGVKNMIQDPKNIVSGLEIVPKSNNVLFDPLPQCYTVSGDATFTYGQVYANVMGQKNDTIYLNSGSTFIYGVTQENNPTPTPTPSPTVTPTPTASPTATPTASPTAIPTVTPTPTPVPVVVNLLTNPSFESGTAPWQLSKDGTTGVITQSSEWSTNGTYSAKVYSGLDVNDEWEMLYQGSLVWNASDRLTLSYDLNVTKACSVVTIGVTRTTMCLHYTRQIPRGSHRASIARTRLRRSPLILRKALVWCISY